MAAGSPPGRRRSPCVRPPQRAVVRLAASGRFRAVVAGLSGRVALPAAYLGARAAHVPFVLWATIWRHPRTAAHALSYLPLRELYRRADAIATYGPHVSAYVRSQGARGPVFEAPQSVDDAFWGGAGGAAAARAVPGRVRRAAGGGEGRRRAAARVGRRRPRRGRARCCWRATARCAPAPSPPARSRRGPRAPRICATSTRAPTSWSYRPSPRATSWSLGGWW